MLITRQDISPQQAETLNEELKALIEGLGGHIAKIEYWGLRNLSYRIKKNRKGHYSLLAIDAPSDAVKEMERQPRSTRTCCATSPCASTSSTWSFRRCWPAATASAIAIAALRRRGLAQHIGGAVVGVLGVRHDNRQAGGSWVPSSRVGQAAGFGEDGGRTLGFRAVGVGSALAGHAVEPN